MHNNMSRSEFLAAIEQQLDQLPDAALPQVLQAIDQILAQSAEQQAQDLQRIFTEDASLLHRLAQ
jgi:uncharacterized membrane protein